MRVPQVGDECCAEVVREGEYSYGVITKIEGDLAWSDLDPGFCGDLPTRKRDGKWVFDSF